MDFVALDVETANADMTDIDLLHWSCRLSEWNGCERMVFAH
jgi:hypothetical protein